MDLLHVINLNFAQEIEYSDKNEFIQKRCYKILNLKMTPIFRIISFIVK